MKYVLDSCVAFKTLLAEQDSDKAQRLREDDKLIRKLQPRFPFIIPLASFP